MKLRTTAAGKLLALASLVPLLSSVTAHGQAPAGGRINLESLDRLAPLAKESSMKAEKSADGKGLVYVREFEFARAGSYSASDLEAVRAQLREPGWSQIVKVEEKDKGGEETVEIYVYGKTAQNNLYAGMVVIASEPLELKVVNIVGRGNVQELMKKVDGKKSKRSRR
jgi:hypothetical protein